MTYFFIHINVITYLIIILLVPHTCFNCIFMYCTLIFLIVFYIRI